MTSWRCYDLFGGALCVRRSWEMIEAAARHLWGVECGLTHTFTVTFLAFTHSVRGKMEKKEVFS